VSVLTNTIKNVVSTGVDLSGKAIVLAAQTALPVLRVPIVSFVFKWLVNWVLSKLQLQPFLQNLFVDLAIDLERNAKKEAYELARVELKAVLKTSVRNAKELQNASDAFDKRFDDLVRIRP